jgi:hypothetical protein
MYYELKWKEWHSGHEWFGIAYTQEEMAQMIEEAKNDTEHDLEFWGYLEVKEEGDE